MQTLLIVFSVVAAFALGGGIVVVHRLRRRVAELQHSTVALGEELARNVREFAEHRAAIDLIVGALREGLLAVSASGKVVFANARVSEMFGLSASLEGRTILEVVRKQKAADAIQKALRGTASSERIGITTPDGERRIEMRVVPVRPSSGIAAVALFIDISELARLERVRRDFLDDFSHEVRTPLAGLRSAAETLEGGRLTPDHEEALRQVMLRQLNRIERLVKDLAELNRIESGDLVLEPRRVELTDVLNDLCNEFRERAGQSVTFTVTGEPAAAAADPVRLQQIFSNLLDNAWKHGGGGKVTVEIARDDGNAIVRISDEGAGIPPAEIDRIFNRFYRVDRSRSQTVPGVGLGLSITKHLVLLHGGSIRAYNGPSGGATFEVRLP
ncbi:MAG TPA: ATP-binding protein, partial [Thermoanaerobaculia bacterium]|nr:ATP-binding protein [Thermoanaerobaculia bacterium]